MPFLQRVKALFSRKGENEKKIALLAQANSTYPDGRYPNLFVFFLAPSVGHTVDENLKALDTGGRIAVIGVSAGAKSELNLLALMGKRARIHGSTLRARPLEEKAITARLVEREVLPLFAAGELRVPVAETFPLAQAVAAYERFAAGGKLGKIVITL